MFPPRIKEFARELIEKTNAGDISWEYDDNSSSVYLSSNDFAVTLRYSFSQIEECGEFVLLYYDLVEQKEYRFYTNQTWNDYDVARRLFESAQSSGMRLPF